jgi:hypothetical protein
MEVILKHKYVNNHLVKVWKKRLKRKIKNKDYFFLACELGPYVPATDCTKTCGNGTQLLNRTCYNVAATSSSVPVLCSNTTLCNNNTVASGSCNPDVCISKY